MAFDPFGDNVSLRDLIAMPAWGGRVHFAPLRASPLISARLLFFIAFQETG